MMSLASDDQTIILFIPKVIQFDTRAKFDVAYIYMCCLLWVVKLIWNRLPYAAADDWLTE